MNVVSFQLNGEQWTLSDADVKAAVKPLAPEPTRTHVVMIDGSTFPVKQAFSAATGLDRLDFTTNQARTVLKRLGLVVTRVDGSN